MRFFTVSLGMAAAIANPFGIGSLFFAALAVGFALRDSAGKVSYAAVPAQQHRDEDDEDLMIQAPWMVGRDPADQPSEQDVR